MAASTTFEPMTRSTAQDVAAEEFSAVVTAHRPQIFRFLLASTRDVDLAETLTQECFLKAHRNWTGFRGDSGGGWPGGGATVAGRSAPQPACPAVRRPVRPGRPSAGALLRRGLPRGLLLALDTHECQRSRRNT